MWIWTNQHSRVCVDLLFVKGLCCPIKVKHKLCQAGIVAGDVTMYNLNFVLEMRCVSNWNSIKTWTRKLYLSTIVLNISALLVKRTQTILLRQEYGIVISVSKAMFIFIVYITICNTLFNLYCIKMRRLHPEWLTHGRHFFRLDL